MEGGDRPGVSADVGEDDRLDGQPAHRTQLIPLLQLPGADVAGHEVSRPSVDDAAVLRPGLTDETGVQARVRQPPLRRHAALQLREHAGRRRSGGGIREKLLGVDGGGGLGVRSPELLLGGRGGRGRLGGGEEILGVGSRGGGIRSRESGV